MSLFDEIIGYDEIKKELFQIIDIFENSELYEKMGAKPVKGVLLYGEPGLGKTSLCNALIEKCKVPSYTLKVNKAKHDFILEINKVFNHLAQNEKSIVFLDDIDKLGNFHNDEANICYNAIQEKMDTFHDRNLLVIATVNDMNELPRSFIRSGRFDRKIRVKAPNFTESSKIIEYYLKQKNVSSSLNFDDVCKMISYSSCADLETIINESAVNAAFERKDCIDIQDITKTYLKLKYDFTNNDYNSSDEEITSVAFHEAGHAVVAEAIKPGSVGFITVQGSKFNIIDGFTYLWDNFKRRPLCVLTALGGKVASEQFYQGRCATGCQSDLEKAYELLYDGITENSSLGIGLIDPNKHCSSPELNTRIDSAIKSQIENYIYNVKDILLKNKEFLFKLVEELKEKKVLLNSDIKRIRESCSYTQFTNI